MRFIPPACTSQTLCCVLTIFGDCLSLFRPPVAMGTRMCAYLSKYVIEPWQTAIINLILFSSLCYYDYRMQYPSMPVQETD